MIGINHIKFCGSCIMQIVMGKNYSQTAWPNFPSPTFRAKRAAWRWARERSAIASRWTWLLAQISDLEYRIRQHNELYQQIKKTKGPVVLEGAAEEIPPPPEQSSVNGYRGILPGSSKPADAASCSYEPDTGTSSRTRPFQRATFRKRKLLQTNNLHTISKKAARSR